MASINNNKESFELLRGTPDSNSGSEVSEIVFPARKKRYRRRLRNNPSTKHEDVTSDCQCKASTISMTLFCTVLFCWLITLTWLAVVLHGQLNRLNSDVVKVVAGSQGVPDALQKCHSLSRELQKNQSQIIDRLNGFSVLLNNFSLEMTEVKNGLHTVQNQLKSSPDLTNNPTIVRDLSKSVASFGSQIKDLGATVSSLKDQNLKLDSIVNNIVNNITEMRTEMTELLSANKEKTAFTEKTFAAEKENILAVINQVSMNITSVNDTLSNKLQSTVDDGRKDHKLIESLQETSANITTRVTTLERLCAKGTESKQSSYSMPVNAAEADVKHTSVTATPIPSPSLFPAKSLPIQFNGSTGGESNPVENST